MQIETKIELAKQIEMWPILWKANSIKDGRGLAKIAWNSISEELHMPVRLCKLLWNNMKSSFQRGLKENKKDHLYDSMKFMIPFMQKPKKNTQPTIIVDISDSDSDTIFVEEKDSDSEMLTVYPADCDLQYDSDELIMIENESEKKYQSILKEIQHQNHLEESILPSNSSNQNTSQDKNISILNLEPGSSKTLASTQPQNINPGMPSPKQEIIGAIASDEIISKTPIASKYSEYCRKRNTSECIFDSNNEVNDVHSAKRQKVDGEISEIINQTQSIEKHPMNHFFQSILPHVMPLSPTKQREFQIKVLELVDSLVRGNLKSKK